MSKRIYFTLLIAIIFSTFAKAEMNVPIQLRLKSPSGTYPTETNLSFKLVILTPATGCILREEDFSSQTITNGNVSLNLGAGVRGVSDPGLTLNQVYDNSKTKTGLICVDANNNITSTGQSYVPASSDSRIIRVLTAIGGDPVLANFNMRATPYAIQAESVGGKSASDLIVKDVTSQMNQTNLNDLLLDVTRFNNLKSIALSGQAITATTAVNFSGVLAGDVSGTQSTASVDKIKGVAVSAVAPTAGQVLQFDGSQYVPANVASGSVVSVAGKSGVVTLVSSDISGFGAAAGMNIGTAAGTVAAGNDSRIVSAYADTLGATALNTASTIVKRDASGNVAASNILTSNNSTNNLYLYDGANSLRLKAPVGLAANYVFTLPADDGAAGQLLRTDGFGNLTWVTGAAGGGTVLDVTASAPLASSGGTNPNLSITQASSGSAGYLSSSDWTNFNSKQAGLGFTPLDADFFNAAVASASCSPGQSIYWNSISSQFLCQAISFPADAVTSVAGRTGAITLSSADISGLGGAAALNVGTLAGTVAAGNDSRMVNAVLISSAFSGDVSGTVAANSVIKIRGTAVSAAAPASGDVLRFNGTQYVPASIPSDAVTSVAGRTGAVVLASSDISGLNFGTSAGTFAQGNDSRMVNAVQTSSAFSGDVSGTSSTISVNKIRGAGVSPTAPVNGDVLQFNGTQYVPVAIPSAAVTSVAGRTGAIVLSTSDISGFSSALQVSDFNGYVASATCTSSQSLYWNSVSSQFLCQNITFPADAVSTVAGRTGAVVLASSDISGLGVAAGLNVGSAADTVAAGDDTRIVNALQTSSTFSGDVSGTSSTITVNKIRGVAVSATAPTAGQAMVYDGTQWVPTTGFPLFSKKTTDQTFNVTAPASATSLSFAVLPGSTYKFKFTVIYTSAATNTGLRLGLTYPTATAASAMANISSGVDGTGAFFQGVLNSSGDSVVAAATPQAAPAVMLAYVEGIIVPSAAGDVQLTAASELAGTNVIILAGSFVEVVIIP